MSFNRNFLMALLILIFSLAACVKDGQDVPQLKDTWIRSVDGMEMVYVPEGNFHMGSNNDEVEFALSLCEQHPDAYGKCASEDFLDEAPQHALRLDDFWIDRTEVTNAQHRLCVEAGVCNPSRLANNKAHNGDDYPVAGIPWADAVEYCSWVGGRLPSEAEWEFAARGPEGSLYPWGDTFECGKGSFSEDCTPCEDGYKGPSPVGSFPQGVSWCGAADMSGNVWEWVADDFADYPPGNSSGLSMDESGNMKILRGGSWGYCPAFVRNAFRYPVQSSADYLAVGFRCVVQDIE